MKKETFKVGAYDWEGYKITDEHIALINAQGKYIIGHAYQNGISIGSGRVKEYDTLMEITQAIELGADIEDMKTGDETGTEIFHNPIKEMRTGTGLSQTNFGKLFGIPMRTIQSWESRERTAPAYVTDMMKRILEEDKLPKFGWVFREYRDKAGIGSETIFKSSTEADKYARTGWHRMNANDQMSYIEDSAGEWICGLTEMEWDDYDEEYHPKTGEGFIIVLFDALEEERR